ncbi:hypothetical protein YC2023_009797 [Brassica napus]
MICVREGGDRQRYRRISGGNRRREERSRAEEEERNGVEEGARGISVSLMLWDFVHTIGKVLIVRAYEPLLLDIQQRQRQQLRSSMMAEKDEKLSFFLEMRGVRKSMIIFFSTIIMSSDLGMVLYVQSLKLLQCSISQVMVQQERKLTDLHVVEEMIDPEATFSNEEGDVSEGGEFLEHWKKDIYNIYRETDKSRGFGFVTMSIVKEAQTTV